MDCIEAEAVESVTASRKNYDVEVRCTSGVRDRYYDPTIGRYVTSDPIGLEGGNNTFGYAVGNPVTSFDPNGLLSRGDAFEPIEIDPFGQTFTIPRPSAGSGGRGQISVPRGAGLALAMALIAMSPGSSNNVIPFPGQSTSTSSCEDDPGDGDPCEPWRIALQAERLKLVARLQRLYRADKSNSSIASAHQSLIREIQEFNQAVEDYNLICDPDLLKIIPTGPIRVIPGRGYGRYRCPLGDLKRIR